MPALYTHYLFARDLLKEDEKHPSLYLLAAQGPDAFFFYGYSLKIRKNKAARQGFGRMLHKIDIAKIYDAMLRYANTKESEEKEILYSFIRGFMFHYCLDHIAHPYVFYRTGFVIEGKKEQKDHKFYSLAHTAFETNLDVLLKEEYAFFAQPKELVKIRRKEGKIVSKMFDAVAKEVFEINLGKNTYYQAYKDFRFVEKFLNSKKGGKKRYFSKHMHDSIMNALSYPVGINNDDVYDYLNLKHSEWLYPETGNKSHKSFLELFEEAKNKTKVVDDILVHALVGQDVLDDLKSFTNGINHDGVKVGEKMRYMHFLCEDGNLFY